MKERGLLGIRAWVWGIALASLTAAGIFVALWISDEAKVAAKPGPAVDDRSRTADLREPDPGFSPDPPDLPPAPPTDLPAPEDMVYALPDIESDLVVTLSSHPGLGQISIERYDENGNPTGEPLPQGTQVQIPDPDRPGKKIYFRVP